MIEISKRLKAVAKQAENAKVLADIGTDHAYVPIYLCQNNKIKKAIACDINKGPLEKAKENIEKYNLQNQIELRLGSGLCKIKPNEADTIVIAGMGGNLIIDILKNSPQIVNTAQKLILQPQLDISEVRKYLHSIGFQILYEEMLIDEGKFYNIMVSEKGEEKYLKEYEYLYGKYLIETKNSVLKEYITYKINKYNNIANKLNEKNTLLVEERKQKISEELEIMKEVLKCL